MKLYLLLFWVSLAACSGSKKLSTAPVAAEPAPRLLPALPASRIDLPIKVYMRPVLAVMDSVTAKEFTNDEWPDYTLSSCDFRYKYRFLRSPFYFSCVNNKVNIQFRGYYQISGSKRVCAFDKQVTPWVGGSCGFGSEPLRKVDISIGSLLEFLPNHQLRTTTRLEQTKALDKCEVTLLQTDITTQILDSIKASVNSYGLTFDSIVQSLNNNTLLAGWRNGGSRVMPLSKYGYLNLNPTQFRMGRFNVNQDTLLFSIGFSGNPQFSSDSLQLVNRSSMPPLVNTPVNSGISTYLNAIYGYPFLNKLLNDSLHNRPFEVEGRTFVINEVKVAGTAAGKIKIDVAFSGNRKGVLHLSGTPVLDSAQQVLTMPDIEFAIDTKDILVNIAKGLFRKKIIRQLKDQSVFDIAALIERNKPLIEARLNQSVTPWLQTQGRLHSLKLVGLLPQKEYVQLQLFINADLTLVGTPPANLLKGF